MAIQVSCGGIVLNTENYHVALVRSLKSDTWSFPKGRVEDGEEFLETAIREVYEETGIDRDSLEFMRAFEPYTRGVAKYPRDTKEMRMHYFRTGSDFGEPQVEVVPEWIAQERVADMLRYKEDANFFRSISSYLDKPTD